MSTPPAYFEAMYAGVVDPWDLAGRWYEQRKYALTLASLPRPRYRSGFEPGCSVGVLTARLAERCDHLLATDRMPSAVVSAAERTRGLPQVEVRSLTVPDEWPDGTFDLIVLSELLYYFDDTALHDVLTHTLDSLEPGGTLVTVHGNHPVPEHHRTGRELAPLLTALPGLRPLTETQDPDFTLQVFWRCYSDASAPPSPAAQEGLVAEVPGDRGGGLRS